MKKVFGFIIAVFASAVIYAQHNDPNAVKVDVKSFHAISVSNAFDVYITQGNEEAVAVSASEEKYRDDIQVEVENGVLKISYKKNNFLKGLSGSKMKLRAYISFKTIDKLSASGACDVFVEGTIKADKLDLYLNGASDLKGKFDVSKMNVDINGASDASISGNVSQLSVEASGASDFKGYDMVTDFCNVKASGASSIQVTVNKELSAHASGASSVRYKGEGVIRDIKTSGASNISRRS